MQQWIHYWYQAKEKTASSISELHFGYYKAHSKEYLIAEVKYKLANIVIINQSPLQH